MAQPPKPLEHLDTDKKSDDALRKEARAHLGDAPALQLVAELYGKLREKALPWWTPEGLRARWSASDRMRWLRARPELRQQITTRLTGLAPRAARKKTPEFQGALIDSVIDEGDVTARAFEEAFDPGDLVVYGPAEEIWQAFVERMPWGDDAVPHQELGAWLFDALLADRSALEGLYRKPILTALDARTAIDGRVWHTRVPLEIRVAIDEARFQKERERPGEPFHAESDLSIAVAATIAASLPLQELLPVFTAAERAMGFRRAGRPEPPAARSAPAPATDAARPRASEAAAPAARPSFGPPPPSVAPPARTSVAPPALSLSQVTASQAAALQATASRKAEAPPATASRPEAKATRGPVPTIPEGLHEIHGEEERTNPWDIPTDVSLPGKG